MHFREALRVFGNKLEVGNKMAEDQSSDPEKNEAQDIPKNSNNPKEFKVILLGMNGVGKTSLFLHIKDGKFYPHVRMRTTDKGFKKTLQVGQERVQMTLYDSAAGMEYDEKTLTKGYYRDSCIALLVYSADNKESVTRMVNDIAQVKDYAPDADMIVVRNKVDLFDQSVREHEVKAKIAVEGYELSTIKHFLGTSALEGTGIKELLLKIGNIILRRQQVSEFADTQASSCHSLRVGNGGNQESQPTETGQSGCC